MAAVKGDKLLFQGSNTVGTVLGTGAAGGTLLVLINAMLSIAQVVQANADTDLAVAAGIPTGAPAVNAFATIGYKKGTFAQPDNEVWRVEGYFTSVGGGATVQAVLSRINDPSTKCYCAASLLFATS